MEYIEVKKTINVHRLKIIEKLKETISNPSLSDVMGERRKNSGLEELLQVYAWTFGEINVQELPL